MRWLVQPDAAAAIEGVGRRAGPETPLLGQAVRLRRMVRTCGLTWSLGRQEMAAAAEDAYC